MLMTSMATDKQTKGEESHDHMNAGARALNIGASAVITGVIMVGASLLLWIGVPAGWLWVGSQIQGSTGNLGTAIFVMLVGAIASIVGLAYLLGWLNRIHEDLREARGAEPGAPLLEVVLVVTAAVALIGFAIWFFVFAGPGPELAPRS
jgi:hypothetical protein